MRDLVPVFSQAHIVLCRGRQRVLGVAVIVDSEHIKLSLNMAEVSQNPSRTVLVAVDNSEYSLEAFECEYSKKSNVNVPVHTQLLTCHLSRIQL